MLDPQSARAALRTYNKLIKGESAGKRAAAELQASLRSAAAQKAELNADINVARTEAIIRLRPLYTVMQRAAQTNDFAAFQTAKEQYVQSFALEQAKHQAVKVRAQNRINAIDNDVKNRISEAEIKAQSLATTVGNGLNTAAADTEGRVTAVGSAVQDEAQGQFAASTVARNSDILNSEGIGSEQGPGEGARDVESETVGEGGTGDFKRGIKSWDEINIMLEGEGLDQKKIDDILNTLKGERPGPSTYLSKDYINRHLSYFKDGVTKIKSKAPTDIEGVGLGTFVMPKTVADEVIRQAGGDVAILEKLLALNPGDLGTDPVRVDIKYPHNIRIPSGNEVGAWPGYWVPGGYTKLAGVMEAVIDPVPKSDYVVTEDILGRK